VQCALTSVCYPKISLSRLRYWLIDVPSQITECCYVWYRLYFLLLLLLAAVTVPALVLGMLVLWYGFGIRWSW
jgi:hypothetical protein